jgi:hypothetical protein
LARYTSSHHVSCCSGLNPGASSRQDLPWRYKLILPPIATLPLLCSYNGSKTMIIPRPFRALLMHDGQLTGLGALINLAVRSASEKLLLERFGIRIIPWQDEWPCTLSSATIDPPHPNETSPQEAHSGRAARAAVQVIVDTQADGKIVDLGIFFMVYMALLAVCGA